MSLTADEIRDIATKAGHRRNLWVRIVRAAQVRRMLELGVYKGEFSERLLDKCERIEAFYMLDPWRHLDDWNKPANTDSERFEEIYREAMQRTEAHADRRIVLRGTTIEVLHEVEDSTLDLAYIDGDHTLRGIAVDLINVWDKVRPDGLVGGDDFTSTIWQHSKRFEPTMVFPFAVHFAEAMQCPVYALPFKQFVIVKNTSGFSFTDLTGDYATTDLLPQFEAGLQPAT